VTDEYPAIKPSRPFRILRHPNAVPVAVYYRTVEARDKAAKRWANRDGYMILTELWDAEHDQSPLNRGWACDGRVEPQPGYRNP
jgi:hypothetical protein